MRKSLMLLAVIGVAALTMAPTAVERTFLKIDGVAGGIVDPMHQGWFQAASFSWGATQASKGPACLAGPGGGPHTLHFTRRGPASAKLAQLCSQHATVPSLNVEVGGERHLLQNVSFAQCGSQPVSTNEVLDTITLNYGRCATHDVSSASSNPALKYEYKHVAPDQKASPYLKYELKYEQPNAILIGLSQPEPETILGLTVNGDGRTATLIRKAGGNQQGTLARALATHQVIPKLTITMADGRKWTLTNVTISGNGFAADTKNTKDELPTERLSLNFTKVEY